MKNCIENRFSEDNIWKSKFLRKTRIVTLFLLLVSITQTFALESYVQTKIVYEISDPQVELTSMLKTGIEQQKTVSGKVTDSSGSPLPGVTVVIKGTTRGTITDANGNYTLPNVPRDATLVFSFLGMKTQGIVVGNQTTVNVTMEEEAIELEEVVAVGYGTMRRSDLTGAVSSVNVEEMNKTVKTSFEQALQGMAAGVLVTQNSTQPGGGVSIRVRGVTSLSSGNEPLYVIDGIPMESGGVSSGANYGPGISGLSLINPGDIESIEILKDASATAVYGARGANGVVLITTKQGKAGEGKVTFSTSLGFQKISGDPNLMNAQEYMEMFNQMLINDNNGDEQLASQDTRWYSEEDKIAIGDGINWLDEILQTGTTQNYHLSASGGRNQATYYISLEHMANDGVVKNSDFKRTSLRINLSNKFTKKITVGSNVSISDVSANLIRTEGERQNSGISSAIYSAMRYRPALHPGETDEDISIISDGQVDNPVGLVETVTNATTRLGVFGNIFAEYKLLNNLTFRTVGAFSYSANRDNFYAPQEGTYNGAINRGIARLGFANGKNLTNTNSLRYFKKFGAHTINALGVFEIIKGDLYRVRDEVSGFINDNLREHNLSSGSNASNPNNYTQEHALMSYLARVNYNYSNKYLLTVSGRYDGSSRFGENNKFAFFPSASVAWRMNNENFLKDVHFIDQLKLRLSYGIAGNQNIPLYSSLSTLTSDSYILGDNLVTGFHPSRIANPDLKWEKREQTNIGLDFGIFKSRISGTVEYFNDITKDLLLARQIPISSGFSSVMSNIGSLRNQGIELTLNTVNIDKEFHWQTSFNISFPKTTVQSLGEDDFMLAGHSDAAVKNTQIIEVGKPIGQFYGYVFDGIAQTEEDVAYTLGNTWIGDYKYKDLSGPEGIPDGVISDAYDKTVIGNALPDFFGGITNTFSYKGFEFSFFFQGTYGNDIMNLNRIYMESSIPFQHNKYRTVLDAWSPDNPDGKIRMLSQSNIGLDASSLLVEDGSYLRLKNVTLSYNLPLHLVSRWGLSNAQINVSGQNLFVLTNYSGWDPEVDATRNNSFSFGHDYFGYPQSKTITTGISVTF